MKKYNDALTNLEKDSFYKRSALFIWGILLYSVSFNLFFSPHDIVTGGSTGIAIIINEIYRIDVSAFVLVFSLITLLIGLIFLDYKVVLKTICGVLILPIFLKFTSIFPEYINEWWHILLNHHILKVWIPDFQFDNVLPKVWW